MDEQEDHDLDMEAAEEILSKYFSGASHLQVQGINLLKIQIAGPSTSGGNCKGCCRYGWTGLQNWGWSTTLMVHTSWIMHACAYHISSMSGQLDMLYKISSAGRSKSNVCRNLRRLIHREGVTLPLEISMVKIPIRKRSPKVKKVMVHYPCIYPSTWLSYLLKKQSYLILGGVDIDQPSKWQGVLSDFWRQYLQYDKDHIVGCAGSPPRTQTVPLYLHGDEGRGKYKLPIMVEAIQPCLSWKGTAYKNSSGLLSPNSVLCILEFALYVITPKPHGSYF